MTTSTVSNDVRKRELNGKSKEKVVQNGKKEKEKDLPEKDSSKSPMLIVFLSLLLDLLAFTMILPLLPSLMEHYSNTDDTGLFNTVSEWIRFFQEKVGAPSKYNSVLFGGFFGSMFSFMQFVASPLVGGLSDVYGRKPVLLLCLVGISFSYILWAFSKNFLLFTIARFVGGISKGNISLSMAIITDVSNSKTRGRGMALVGIAFSIGFVVGPMIGALFSTMSDKSASNWFFYPAMFAFGLAFLNVIFISTSMKESLPREKRSKRVINSLSKAIEFINVFSLFKFEAVKGLNAKDLASLKKLGFIYFIYLFIYSGLEFTVTFLMYHQFGFTSMDQAKVFLTTGVIMALIQGSVVRRLPEKTTKKAAVFGLYLIVPAFITVGLANSVQMLYAGMILFAISTAFVVTCMATLTSSYGNVDQKGTVLGIFRSLGALARALGPIFASIVFWCIGSNYTYILGGILLLQPALSLHFAVLS